MSAINLETFSGGTFNFYIGPDKVLFVLYKCLVSRYSEPLKQMMSNGMKESQEGAAFLEHVDVDTFGRFAEYVHSGDYSAASPVEVAPQPEEELPPQDPEPATYDGEEPQYEPAEVEVPPEPPEVDPAPVEWKDWGSTFQRPKHKKKSRKSAAFWQDEQNIPAPIQPFPVVPAPGPNLSSSTSYVPTFAGHIHAFHFAEEYLVPGFKQLARHRFKETLKHFECYPERAADICHVIQLIYSHENGSSDPQSLHDIVSQYAADNFRVLMDSSRFKTLLSEGGAFPPDVCDKVSELIR